MSPEPAGGFKGIPKKLIPFRFRLAGAQNRTVIVGLFSIYVLIGGVLLLFYRSIGQRIGWANGLQILAIGGELISVAILVFSISVQQYSQEKYLSSFTGKAEILYPENPPEALEIMLKQFHGELQNHTSSILKNEVGATLVGISTIVGFIAALLKG